MSPEIAKCHQVVGSGGVLDGKKTYPKKTGQPMLAEYFLPALVVRFFYVYLKSIPNSLESNISLLTTKV